MSATTHWTLPYKNSLIPACDVTLDVYEELVKQTCDLPMVSAYKIGFVLGLSAGLPRVVEVTRRHTDKPLIYDHQKAGTDIPDTGEVFAKTLKDAGIDAVILFPQAGPKTEEAWIKAAQNHDLGVIVGGWMTHQSYKQPDDGYLTHEGVLRMYKVAAELGVTEYVVPGNQPDVITSIRALLLEAGVQPSFYSPGLLTQGGGITEAAQAAEGNWHAIVGRRIYRSPDFREAAQEIWPSLASLA